MIEMKLSLEDMDGFETQLEEVRAAIKDNLREVALDVKTGAKANLEPRRKTGNLEKSIRMKISRYEDGGYIVYASGNKDKGYHAFNVEYGHVMILWGKVTGKRVEPAPFLRPAVEEAFKRAIILFRSAK